MSALSFSGPGQVAPSLARQEPLPPQNEPNPGASAIGFASLGLDRAALGLSSLPQVAARPAASVSPLPAEPASLSLVLCGLGSLGAWRLGRLASRLNLMQVPDWYHTGGPWQVAHAVPAAPDGTGGLHVLCPFEAPQEDTPDLVLYRLRCQSPPILQPQRILTSRLPTGPPFLSC